MLAERPEAGNSYLWFLAAGLGLYCVVLTAITGNIGFDGDDWWVLSCAYWHIFPDALVAYTRKFLRPVEGLYWIGLFKLFGFKKVVFHLCSLMLLAASAVLTGVSLDRAFPGRRGFVSIAVLLAFFLPPVSCLTYVMFTDNSRLSMLLFWISVIAFQRWARKPSSWLGLSVPLALYLFSFLTYETAGFLIFLVPLLVLPVYLRYSDGSSVRVFTIRLGAGILAAFCLAVAARFVLLDGGAVKGSHLVPPFELFWSYLALLPFYLFAPFAAMSADTWALLAGLLVLLGVSGLFIWSGRASAAERTAQQGSCRRRSTWYLIALGVGIFLLGMLPYQLAGYGSSTPRLIETLLTKCRLLPDGDLSWFNFTWASRIYSSASFGLAILLALGLSAWRSRAAKAIMRTAALIAIGSMAVFHAGLSRDWREAAEIRNDLVRSLVSQVPAVRSGTNFVFLDIVCSHKRATVIREENGLRELIEMLYGDRTLEAWRLYPDEYDPLTHMRHQAAAMPDGFLSGPGQGQWDLAPLDSLLLFKRSGRKFVLLDRIGASDGLVPTGIAWKGADHLTSHLERIESWSAAKGPRPTPASNAWTSGLISTFELERLKSALASLRPHRYVALDRVLHARFLRMRLHQFDPHF